MAALLNYLGMTLASVGIFFGFYYLSQNPLKAMNIVTLFTVGLVGLVAFIRHVLFHKSDAQRMGWETDRPDWMFEVGFANLSFSVMAFWTLGMPLAVKVQSVLLLGYSIYLFQAALLHGYRYVTEEPKSPRRLWGSCVSTLLYVGAMLVFAWFGWSRC